MNWNMNWKWIENDGNESEKWIEYDGTWVGTWCKDDLEHDPETDGKWWRKGFKIMENDLDNDGLPMVSANSAEANSIGGW